MPAYSIKRTTVIAAPAEKVFDAVADFSTWPIWSPWLQVDPSAKLNYTGETGTAHSAYQWEGEVVGQGEMEHLVLDRPGRIKDDLRFIKPMKSRSNVSFDFERMGESTKVTWSMNGKLPWFLFWLQSTITTFVSMDYDRGLRMLKEYVETGNVLSKLEVIGIENIEDLHVVGTRHSATLGQIGVVMKEALSKVNKIMSSSDFPTEIQMTSDSATISVYHPVNLKHGRFDFTSGVTLPLPITAPEGLQCTQIRSGKFLHLRHTGSYDNLGNAWSGGYQYARAKKLKLAKRDGFEIYRNDPNVTPASELITDVYVPLKRSV